MSANSAPIDPKPRALVADDERSVRVRVRRSLEALGYEVVEASDGRMAQETLEREDFHRVFLNVMMPCLDGFEVLKWLRHHPTKGGTWVAMMTAMTGDRDVFERQAYRADHYVLKPVDLDRLLP